ncbi:hypothetical protein ACEWY4_003898 [Coilia grayii]|uniref:Integrase catalytic domain-containing protein n=1 Tax=Coilia grayii TaxID=363190 RepID=A0ABD1KK07_9TELE
MFNSCVNCRAPLEPEDGHRECPSCLGVEHLRQGLTELACADCMCLSMAARTARLAMVGPLPDTPLVSGGQAAGTTTARLGVTTRSARAATGQHPVGLAQRVDKMSADLEEVKALLASLRPQPAQSGSARGHTPAAWQPECSPSPPQLSPASGARGLDVLSIQASESMDCGGSGTHDSTSPAGSQAASHDTAAASEAGRPSVQPALKAALARLGLDTSPVAQPQQNAFFRGSAQPSMLDVPPSAPYIEELQRCWADPSRQSHLPTDCRALAAMRDASAYGLQRMPGIEPSVAALVLSPNEALRPDARCPRPQCRGNRGPKGMAGRAGTPGKDGQDGQDGQQGTPGPPGPQGPLGYRGEPGSPGEKGDEGSKGAHGRAGSVGPPGPQGIRGVEGHQGPSGPDGEDGLEGSLGLPGPPGAPGMTGLVGAPGANGSQGDKGPAGAPGAPGPQVTRHTKAPLAPFKVPERRFDHVNVDLVGPLPPSRGCTYLFTTVDRTTRWPEVVPLSSTTASEVARAFIMNWVARFGTPLDLSSDRGPQFTSELWTAVAEALGMKIHNTTAYNPQSNGLCERFHRDLKATLRASLTGNDWADRLPWVMRGASFQDSDQTPALPRALSPSPVRRSRYGRRICIISLGWPG